MRSLLQYLILTLFLFTISLYPKVRHIYEADGAQAIQDSLDVSDAGDTVMVHNGKYYIGDLPDPTGIQLQGKRLMSVSPDSAPYCTLTGLSSSGLDTAFRVIRDYIQEFGAYSLIQGFTVTRGKSPDSLFLPGAIFVSHYYDDTVIIRNNIVAKNWGAGISETAYGDITIIEDNLVFDNRGPGITLWNFNEEFKIIKNNIITDNLNFSDSWYMGFGGGIYLESGLIKMSECDEEDKLNNLVRGVNSQIIEDNIIMNNHAKCGGGIAFGYNIGGEISRNLIVGNESRNYGGGVYCHGGASDYDKLKGVNNIIIGNKADIGGAIFSSSDSTLLKSNFVVDNGAVQDSSGLLYLVPYYSLDSPHFVMETSNIYYNTYQKDREVFLYSATTTNFQDNYWWVTDSAAIDSLIGGKGTYEFMPFLEYPVSGTPGEPTDIYSVLNYNSDYSTIVDSLGEDPDTLYLEITGNDRNSQFQEAAVAILKSNIYPTGIAVALLETDSASGIYRWKGIVKTTFSTGYVRTDDINQTIRVDPDGDTIKIIANMDNSEIFKVYYRCQGGIEGEMTSRTFQISTPDPNPFYNHTLIEYKLSKNTDINISIYTILGQKIKELYSGKQSRGVHHITWNGTGQEREKLPGGIYFCYLKTPEKILTEKIVLIR